MIITSKDNAHFRRWLSLHSSKGTNKYQQFLIFGEKVINEAFSQQNIQLTEILTPTNATGSLNFPTKNLKHYELSSQLFKQIDLFGTNHPIIVAQKPSLQAWSPTSTSDGLTLLCPIGNPDNLGSLIRSATAFGVESFVLLKEACSPFHPKSVRSSSGTLWKQNFFSGPSIHDIQPTQDNWFALDAKGTPLPQVKWHEQKRIILLVGEEGPGLPNNLKNNLNLLSVPIMSDIESLNATIATSIALYEIKKGAILARRD